MNKRLTIFSLMIISALAAQAQHDLSITQPNGLKVVVVNKNFPLLKILLPSQPTSDRGIEVEFPEHVTGVDESSNEVKQLYFVSRGNSNKRTLPTWRVDGTALIYETDLDDQVKMTARATLEPDGLRYTYEFNNRSNRSYINFQAVTCVKLYSVFSDTLLQRTYVHHSDGFDLLASETPERLSLPANKWLPCRYLVSYSWPLNPKSIERQEGVTRYNKSRKADKPFIATYSHDKSWIAATYTKETGNLWNNPERSCQHADPSTALRPGQTKTLELKTFVVRGNLAQMLEIVNNELKR